MADTSPCPRCGARRIGGRCLACLRARTHLSRAATLHRKARRKRAPSTKKRSDIVADIALEPWMAFFATLPVLGGQTGRLVTNPPKLHVRRATSKPRRRLAFADYDRHLIHVTAYPGITADDVLETLLHEVVHLSDLKLRKHDRRYKTTLATAAYEAFGVDCRRQVSVAVYKLDVLIVEAMKAAEWDRTTPPSVRE